MTALLRILALAGALLLTTMGCESIKSASGSVSYDVDDQLIAASITITFRAQPTPTTQNELVAVGAREISTLVWSLPSKTKANPLDALRAALKEGAVLSPAP